MEKIVIFGISTDKKFSDYEKHFTESDWSDGDTMYFESNETFEHIDDGFSFKYKFIVEVAERYWENKEDFAVALQMVVLPQSCNLEKLERIAESSGIEVKEITWRDLLMEGGFNVTFGEDICKKDEIRDTIIKISHVYECMNGLFGFYLDKVWNRIGSNGWDVVSHAVLGTNLFDRRETA